MHPRTALLATLCLLAGCGQVVEADTADAAPVGAWRAHVRFRSGAFEALNDLEFMLVFNAGGTLTESSNYDGAPPVPPAYGVWRRTGPRTFEAVYEFYATKAPAQPEALAASGWGPAGRGRFVERITLAADGRAYTSTLAYTALDGSGRPIEGSGEADVHATRIDFP